MGGAVETFCGQDYGAKQYQMLGIHLQRAMLVLTLILCVPISFLWANTGHIFAKLGQDSEISAQAGAYARYLISSIFPYGLLQCQIRFLQTQNNVLPLMISAGITSSVHVLVSWTLVFRFGFGSKGAALSSAISYWINVLFLVAYIKFLPACRKTWTGFSKDGMRNLLSFLIRCSFSPDGLGSLEFWTYEFMVLMSGLLPNPKLETSMMSISLNTSSVIYIIPFEIGSAVSTRVSNELGAGNPGAAKVAGQVVLILAIAEGILLTLILLSVRDIWGYLYTNEEEVVKYLAIIMPVRATSNFMDSIQGVLSEDVVGRRTGAFVNLGAYYLLGLPSAIILTFVVHLGGKGLWMGIISGSGLQAVLLLVLTASANWVQEARKAMERVNGCSIPTITVSS